MTDRTLRVLIIDDNKDIRISRLWNDALEFIHVGSFKSITDILATGKHSGADIIAVDLNMEQMNPPEELEWGPGTFPSFGMTLALPFLRADFPLTFVPYSGNWAQTDLAKNGHIVVGCALLRSADQGSPETISTTYEWLRDSRAKAAGNLNDAIDRGLESYRKSLCRYKKGRLLNVRNAIRRLEVTDDSPARVPRSLEDQDGPIGIGIRSASARIETIRLSSVFADILKSDTGKYVSSQAVREICNHLHEWKENSLELNTTLYDAAKKIFHMCMRRGVDLKDMVQKNKQLWQGLSRYEVIRLGMLFAWVEAAYLEQPRGDTESKKPRENQILEVRGLAITRVHQLLGMHGREIGNRTRRYEQYLSQGSKVSNLEHRTPFRKSYSGTSEAYQLGKTTDSGDEWVTKNDCNIGEEATQLCRFYAEEELGWLPEDRAYPGWMAV